MGIRTFAVASFTTEAVADTTNMANSKHMTIVNAASTQVTRILEVQAGGLEPSTSSPQKLLLALDSTHGTTLTALTTGESDTPDDSRFSALASPILTYTACTGTAVQRGKLYLANFPFNALGGVIRERFIEGREPLLYGTATSAGSGGLSGFTGTTPGLIGAHIKYETV